MRFLIIVKNTSATVRYIIKRNEYCIYMRGLNGMTISEQEFSKNVFMEC